jgi:hypothetical protein
MSVRLTSLSRSIAREEQERTDNPFLEISRRGASILTTESVGSESV